MRNAYIGGVNCVESFDDVPRVEMSVLSPADVRTELVMLGLRTREGVDESLLKDRDLSRVESFLEREGGRVRLTRRGVAVMNSVLAEMI